MKTLLAVLVLSLFSFSILACGTKDYSSKSSSDSSDVVMTSQTSE